MLSIFKFLILSKHLLPFVVCIFTYIAFLFVYKTIFKIHRNNPISYIVSFVTTAILYFAFIDIFKLSRWDYFLDGFNFFLRYFKSFGAYLFLVLSNLAIVAKSCNIAIITSILQLEDIILPYLTTIGFDTCAYIAMHTSYKFKKLFRVSKNYFKDTISIFYIFSVKTNQLNCVYTC